MIMLIKQFLNYYYVYFEENEGKSGSWKVNKT